MLIKPSTLTPWLQGKVDPASLDILTFDRLAQVKGCSIDELAILLNLKKESPKTPLDRLRQLVTEMLEGLSQEQLGRKLGISRNTIRGWLNPSKSIDPSQIPAGTIANLAQERGWTIERLLAYFMEECQSNSASIGWMECRKAKAKRQFRYWPVRPIQFLTMG